MEGTTVWFPRKLRRPWQFRGEIRPCLLVAQRCGRCSPDVAMKAGWDQAANGQTAETRNDGVGGLIQVRA